MFSGACVRKLSKRKGLLHCLMTILAEVDTAFMVPVEQGKGKCAGIIEEVHVAMVKTVDSLMLMIGMTVILGTIAITDMRVIGILESETETETETETESDIVTAETLVTNTMTDAEMAAGNDTMTGVIEAEIATDEMTEASVINSMLFTLLRCYQVLNHPICLP